MTKIYEKIKKILNSNTDDISKGKKLNAYLSDLEYDEHETDDLSELDNNDYELYEYLWSLFNLYPHEYLPYCILIKYSRKLYAEHENKTFDYDSVFESISKDKAFIELERKLYTKKTYNEFNIDTIVAKYKNIVDSELGEEEKSKKIHNFYEDENYEINIYYPVLSALFKLNNNHPFRLLPARLLIKYTQKIIEDYENGSISDKRGEYYQQIIKEITKEDGFKRLWRELRRKNQR